MNRADLLGSLCLKCRLSMFGVKITKSWATPRRYRSGTASRPDKKHTRPVQNSERRHFEAPHPPRQPFQQFESWPRRPPFSKPSHLSIDRKAPAFFNNAPHVAPPEIPPEGIPYYFETHVREWTRDTLTQERLMSFGIRFDELPRLLEAFADAVESKSLSDPEGFKYYDLARFGQPLNHRENISVIYSTVFFSWAAHPAQRDLLIQKYNVQPSTLALITRLTEATDRRFLAEAFARTRRMHRKVIMHVGPTNSGKTHHALRALAAAPMGVYAGPLRLLAHEIWERLNLGQIVPLGAEDGSFKNEDSTHLAALPHADAVKHFGKPEYARLTNMITGEEQKIVSDRATLLSCTVEMLHYSSSYDVAVVDEIQMITDPGRGSGWTSAVLGLAAKELHLCGEETAVPIVEALLKGTGDELIVKRYERLTPLVVEDQSLEGDYSKVRKGDCIVTFKRSNIFDIKRRVEAMTGLRCAVVYGRLPPEIRSEQAALFNDPNSGYDVLVGSDAIGMGLNLKIRRVVFEAVEKYSGGSMEKLSISQVKQIAGRAGRFGLQGDAEPGGFTTTLNDLDLPYLREAIGSPFAASPFARITFDADTFSELLPILPRGSSTSTVIQAHHYIGRLPSLVRYQDSDLEMLSTFDFIDEFAGSLTNRERVLHLNAPVGWRDPLLVSVMKKILEQARDRMYVDLESVLRTTRFMEAMEAVEKAMETGRRPRATLHSLSTLESFHKSLVLYIWMTFRAPVLYPQYELATELKERLEKVLQWSLEGMSDMKHLHALKKTEERTTPASYKGYSQSRAHIPSRSKYTAKLNPPIPSRSLSVAEP